MEEKDEARIRIRIEDLPEDMEVSEEDLKQVQGGWSVKTIVGTIWAALGGGGGTCDTDSGSGVCGVRA